ncbi:hypothetical protein VTN77DRAFT_3618 [Rasamsonia byssochlamydoides]|uniref:uncharacterized protein n=1 Tax=Rasamsonia byssochlamydoides TaxID=89139 RepID=UPI00374301C6
METATKHDDGVMPGDFAPMEKHQRKPPREEDNHEMNGISTQKVSDSDHSLSSDNDDSPVQPVAMAEADEAEDVLGVSISRTQSRMKARQTPAEEKTRAMVRSGGYFDPIPDTETAGEYLPSMTAEPESLPTEQETKKPDSQEEKSQATKEIKDQPRTSLTRSILKGSFPVRRLTWSGDAISNLNLKKLLPDLSSLTKRTSLSSSKTSSGVGRPRSQHVKSTSAAGLDTPRDSQLPAGGDGSALSSGNASPTSSEDGVPALKPLDSSTMATHSFQQRPSVASLRPPLTLRRSASDQSLYVRCLSRTSSLDQRPLYENVHSQVNSRFKAIKDSLQDSSSRLLSMPNFNLPDIRGEWNPGRFLSDGSQRKDSGQTNKAQPNGVPQPSTHSQRPRANTMYPILTEALSQMTGDVVVMGGYRGSVLRSAKPPHRQLWVPMKVGLNIRKVDLEVGLTHEDEERMEEMIIASEVLSHIGPVDICRRLIHKMRKCENVRKGELRVWDYGYDWRLSPHYLANRLIKFLEGLPCNAPDVPREKRGAFVIAHSLGGLITRHAVNQRPELFAGVVYAGTPQHCVNILGPLRNGDDVLLSSRVLTAQVNFTFRTSYALLPEDGRCFIDKRTKEDYLVDFFSVKSWEEYRFSPCIAAPLPPLGSENRKSLIETLPNSLPSLPKIGLGKRFSTILGSKDGMTADTPGTRSSREEERVENVPRDRDDGGASQTCAGKAAASENLVVENLVGPSTAPNMSSSTNAVVAAATSTIPRADAIAYLERTLAEVLRFKKELAFNESHQSENRYPPFAVLYSKCLPTVYGARVRSREHIKCRDAYDDLAFAAGDGVCLASAAMLPPGYRVIKGGLVKTDRGHVSLLGDLEAVGECLLAIVKGRKAGVGLGRPEANKANVNGETETGAKEYQYS